MRTANEEIEREAARKAIAQMARSIAECAERADGDVTCYLRELRGYAEILLRNAGEICELAAERDTLRKIGKRFSLEERA